MSVTDFFAIELHWLQIKGLQSHFKKIFFFTFVHFVEALILQKIFQGAEKVSSDKQDRIS